MTHTTPGAARATVYYSTVSGFCVAWDVCGVCRRHVTVCGCDDGPAEPGYLADGRTAFDPPVSASPPVLPSAWSAA